MTVADRPCAGRSSQERGPAFLRLANAVATLYPKGNEEKKPARNDCGWLNRADLNTRDEGMFDRITFDLNIMGGRACIRGMRIPVSVIVGQIAHGATWEEVLEGYPDLEREDIQQAIEYAAWLTLEEVRTG